MWQYNFFNLSCSLCLFSYFLSKKKLRAPYPILRPLLGSALPFPCFVAAAVRCPSVRWRSERKEATSCFLNHSHTLSLQIPPLRGKVTLFFHVKSILSFPRTANVKLLKNGRCRSSSFLFIYWPNITCSRKIGNLLHSDGLTLIAIGLWKQILFVVFYLFV